MLARCRSRRRRSSAGWCRWRRTARHVLSVDDLLVEHLHHRRGVGVAGKVAVACTRQIAAAQLATGPAPLCATARSRRSVMHWSMFCTCARPRGRGTRSPAEVVANGGRARPRLVQRVEQTATCAGTAMRPDVRCTSALSAMRKRDLRTRPARSSCRQRRQRLRLASRDSRSTATMRRGRRRGSAGRAVRPPCAASRRRAAEGRRDASDRTSGQPSCAERGLQVARAEQPGGDQHVARPTALRRLARQHGSICSGVPGQVQQSLAQRQHGAFNCASRASSKVLRGRRSSVSSPALRPTARTAAAPGATRKKLAQQGAVDIHPAERKSPQPSRHGRRCGWTSSPSRPASTAHHLCAPAPPRAGVDRCAGGTRCGLQRRRQLKR